MDCERAKSLILPSAIITACDLLPNSYLRLQTTFEYPGNEFVDLLIKPQAMNAPLRMTDGGMTVSHLLGFGLDLDKTDRRRQFVKAVCEQLGVVRDGGEFTIEVPDPVDAGFGAAAVRLGQACVRIADLIITHQTRLNSTFSDELEEGFEALRVAYEPNVPLVGKNEQVVRVDYILKACRLPIALYGISAKSQANAKSQVNATFRKWYELEPRRVDYQFVTLLDSQAAPLWNEPDRSLLEELSEVYEYPSEADAFRELVTSDK